MKAIVNKYVNIRIGNPEVKIDNNPAYYHPGDEVEIADTVIGDNINGNKIWFQLTNGSFLSSEGIANPFPSWIEDFGINELWNYTRGENITVIIIDSGFANCDDVTTNKVSSLSLIDNSKGLDNIGHGTLMASIIAGMGKSIAGIAKEVNIVALKITNVQGEISPEVFIKALDKIFELAERSINCIVNCSLRLQFDISQNDLQTIQSKINKLSSDFNVIFVAAVGNESQSIKTIPAGLQNVISCAGFYKSPEGKYSLLIDSNYWPDIKVTAHSTFPSKQLNNIFPLGVSEQGSSHACAFISGLVSLVSSRAKQKKRDIDFSFVSDFIKSSSLTINSNNNPFKILDKKLLLQNFKNI